MTRKTTWLLARLAGTAGLLGFLFWKLDLSSLRERLHTFRPAWYLAGLATILLYVVIQALILQRLLASRGQAARTRDLARMIFISSFFGLFLPGSVGADAALCYALFRTSAAKEDVISSIVFARIVTLLGMVALAFGTSLSPLCPMPALRWAALALVAAAAGGYLVVAAAWRRWRSGIPAGPSPLGLAQRAVQFGFRAMDVLAAFGRDGRMWLRVVPLVLAIGFIRIGLDYVSAASLGLRPPLVDFFVFTPAITVATMLPVTIAGFGVREGSFVYLFSQVGVSGADALAISEISFSYTLWVSLIGAVFYAASGVRAGGRAPSDQ